MKNGRTLKLDTHRLYKGVLGFSQPMSKILIIVARRFTAAVRPLGKQEGSMKKNRIYMHSANSVFRMFHNPRDDRTNSETSAGKSHIFTDIDL